MQGLAYETGSRLQNLPSEQQLTVLAHLLKQELLSEWSLTGGLVLVV